MTLNNYLELMNPKNKKLIFFKIKLVKKNLQKKLYKNFKKKIKF